MTHIIHFYSVAGAYGEFSNFAPYPINLKGKTWPTSEHYFQEQKFEDPFYQKEILKAESPLKAAQLGRNRKMKIKKNWDAQRDNVMYDALFAKFTQHPELQIILLGTEDAVLIEHTKHDAYWGNGGDGSGKNKLGKLLMKLRDEINE